MVPEQKTAFRLLLLLTSCDDNNANGGAPEIHAVRITDPAKADSTFTQTYAGRMIVIVGKNLQNTKKYIIMSRKVL
jgi:hypothetical protein